MSDEADKYADYVNEYFGWAEASPATLGEEGYEKYSRDFAARMKRFSPEFKQKHAPTLPPVPPSARPDFYVAEYQRWKETSPTLDEDEQKLYDVAMHGRLLHALGPKPERYSYLLHPKGQAQIKADANKVLSTAERQRMILDTPVKKSE